MASVWAAPQAIWQIGSLIRLEMSVGAGKKYFSAGLAP